MEAMYSPKQVQNPRSAHCRTPSRYLSEKRTRIRAVGLHPLFQQRRLGRGQDRRRGAPHRREDDGNWQADIGGVRSDVARSRGLDVDHRGAIEQADRNRPAQRSAPVPASRAAQPGGISCWQAAGGPCATRGRRDGIWQGPGRDGGSRAPRAYASTAPPSAAESPCARKSPCCRASAHRHRRPRAPPAPWQAWWQTRRRRHFRRARIWWSARE